MKEIEINLINSSSTKYLPNKRVVESIRRVLYYHKKKKAAINIIYSNEETIRSLNKQYLNHDYVTDVLSFSLGENNEIDGEIYISADTAASQAKEYKVSLSNEITRLAVHGTLHILGYNDETDEERKKMTEFENKFLLNKNV